MNEEAGPSGQDIGVWAFVLASFRDRRAVRKETGIATLPAPTAGGTGNRPASSTGRIPPTMKRLLPLSAAVATGVGIFLLAAAVFADPVNPSFETGNLAGWESETSGSGTVDVVTECDGCETPFSPWRAQSGRFFALLFAGDEDQFTNVTQTFLVPGGSVVSGWVIFCNDEEVEEGQEEGDVGQAQTEPSECSNGENEPMASRTAAELTDQYCDEVRVAYRVQGGPAQEAYSVNACEHFSTDWTMFDFGVPGPNCQPVAVELFAGIANIGDSGVASAMGLDNIQVDDSHCVTQRPNIGAGLSGLFQGQPTPLPTAPSAVAPAATAPTISPPRTGDAGLVDESSATLYGVVAAGFVLAVLSVHRLVRR